MVRSFQALGAASGKPGALLLPRRTPCPAWAHCDTALVRGHGVQYDRWGNHVGLFDNVFGKGRIKAQAQSAELRGDFARAIELWVAAGAPDEASRVMVMRGDAEPEARARLGHFTQAASLATEGSAAWKIARTRRAQLMIALVGDQAVSAVAQRDLLDAARDLEAVGEHQEAAVAYARAKDREGQARALAAAGEVDELEHLLSSEQFQDRKDRARAQALGDIEVLLASGRRREALAKLDAICATGEPGDAPELRATQLRRKPQGPVFDLEVHGRHCRVPFGAELIVGRSDALITVPSSAVSRHHLRVFREGGRVLVEDLGSRNGTLLHGALLRGAIPVEGTLDLMLGREVPLHLSAGSSPGGALSVRISGQEYLVPLGPLSVDEGAFAVDLAGDGFLELSVPAGGHAFAGVTEWTDGATLLVGDQLSSRRDGARVFAVRSR
jgi:hypothetical protein